MSLTFFTILEQIKIDQDIFQVINMAFLTILIPLAIAIFRDKKEFEDLDKNVILEYIIQAKYFLFYLALMFVPLLFWNISSGKLRFFELTIWIFGIYFMIRILIHSYYWMKGKKFNLRFSYLRNLKDTEEKEMEESWRSVWETEKINLQNEREFFKIFSSTIEKLLKTSNGKLKLISKLLGDFEIFISNRSIILLMQPNGPFQKILEWHFRIWKKNYEYLKDTDKLEEWGDYNEILRILDSLLFKIEERVLQERMAFSFFKSLENHTEKYKDEKVNDHYYIDYLICLNGFCKKLFEDIPNSPEHYSIWEHYFPKQWKITKANLEKKLRTSWGMLNCFLGWSRDRICSEKSEKYDAALDEVFRELFPEVDPITFADILVFAICPWSGKRTEFFITKKRSFGLAGRIRTFGFYFNPADIKSKKEREKESFEQMEKLRKEEEQKAIELGYYLFKDRFTSERLKKYIEELEELKGGYAKDSVEEDRRKRLIEIFKKISELAKEKTN
jgi:hypothetical protein